MLLEGDPPFAPRCMRLPDQAPINSAVQAAIALLLICSALKVDRGWHTANVIQFHCPPGCFPAEISSLHFE